MNFNNDEKDVLFLSLNAIIKNYEKWNRIENKDKYYFLTTRWPAPPNQILPKPLITNDQLKLLKYDNIKSKNGVSNFDLGIPSKFYFDKSIREYAYNWREEGKFSLEKK